MPKIGGSDWLYLGLGAGALYLILKNQKPISSVVSSASNTVSPLLNAAGKGAQIVTDPESWKIHTPFEYDYGGEQAIRALKLNPLNPLYWLNVPYSWITRGWSQPGVTRIS